MRELLAAAGFALRSQLGLGRILLILSPFPFLLLLSAVDELGAEADFGSRSLLLELCLLLPGLVLAAGLRQRLPLLGPGDRGLSWLENLGRPPLCHRTGLLLGSLLALLGLQLLSGLGAAAYLALDPGCPSELRPAQGLRALGDQAARARQGFLVRAGDYEDFRVPPAAAGSRIRLESLRFQGAGGGVKVSTALGLPDQDAQRLGEGSFRTTRSALEFALPEALPGGARLRVIRLPGEEAGPLSLSQGRVLLLGPGLDPLLAGLRLSLSRLPLALLLLCLALGLSSRLGSELAFLGILALLPILSLVPALWPEPASDRLGQGRIPGIPGPDAWVLTLALVGLLPGLLLPRPREELLP